MAARLGAWHIVAALDITANLAGDRSLKLWGHNTSVRPGPAERGV